MNGTYFYILLMLSFIGSDIRCLPKTAHAYFPLQKHASLYKKLALEHPVRVLLCESIPTDVHWKLSCEGGISLYDPITGRTNPLADKVVELSSTGTSISYNSKKITRSQLFFLPKNGILHCNGIGYPGIISLERTTEATYLVNHVGLEPYIECVLPYEGVPSWPDEVQKAMCIACRTYAVTSVSNKRALGRDWPYPFDLYSSVDDQVYRGYESGVSLKRIIEATKGLIITHGRKPILAMFSAVCGGVIPAEKKAVVFELAPYLKRSYACTHCKDNKYFRWENTLPLADLEGPLKKEFPELKAVASVAIDGFDPAGIAQHVLITDTENKTFRMIAHDFRMLFYKHMRSACCEIVPHPHLLQMKGKGYGHHIGLCQWGAYAMDLQGHSHKAILSFFYPGTLLTRLKKGTILKNW